MSKSVGNTIEVAEAMKHYGADVCRWWVSSVPYDNDIRMDLAFLDATADSYRKVRNTLRFLLSNLFDFEPCTADSPAGMCVDLNGIAPTSLEAWLLGETRALYATVTAAYEAYDFRHAHQGIFDFCNETLSAIYCAAVKDRLYCDRSDSPRRRATQTVMWDLIEVLTRLLAPPVPRPRGMWRTPPRTGCGRGQSSDAASPRRSRRTQQRACGDCRGAAPG